MDKAKIRSNVRAQPRPWQGRSSIGWVRARPAGAGLACVVLAAGLSQPISALGDAAAPRQAVAVTSRAASAALAPAVHTTPGISSKPAAPPTHTEPDGAWHRWGLRFIALCVGAGVGWLLLRLGQTKAEVRDAELG